MHSLGWKLKRGCRLCHKLDPHFAESWEKNPTHICLERGDRDDPCVVPRIKQNKWGYVSKSHPWFYIQVNWQAESGCANKELNIPAVFWTWQWEMCMHPETAAHWCQPPACNYLTASPPNKSSKAAYISPVRWVSNIIKPKTSNIDKATHED